MKMKALDHDMLLTLNKSSIQAKRRQNLRPEQMPSRPQERYWINAHTFQERDDVQDIRICVVLDMDTSQTAWLDVSPSEFAAIQELDVSVAEWETAMCAGTPRTVR
ncbi:MAG: hypothetical protein IIB33_00535 [Chloroflexi bacterium]|nr:hypothetical protein [Chloroflexota bacterium]